MDLKAVWLNDRDLHIVDLDTANGLCIIEVKIHDTEMTRLAIDNTNAFADGVAGAIKSAQHPRGGMA